MCGIRQGRRKGRRQVFSRRAGAVVWALLLGFVPVPRGVGQTDAPPLVPLAYIRRLTLAPVALETPPDDPLPSAPKAGDTRGAARWKARQTEREAFAALRAGVPATLGEEIRARLSALAGLTLAETTEPSDAVLHVTVDRFGTRQGFERSVWLRIVGWLKPADGRPPRGPFHAFGMGRAGRKLLGFGKGYARTDAQLARDAAAQATRQMVHALTTGQEMPFARHARIAIVPALLPEQVEKRTEKTPETITLSLPSLLRQGDVLLQPEVGPVAAPLDADEVMAALRALDLRPADFWTADGATERERLRDLAERLRADYLFISRVAGLELTEKAVMSPDAGKPREGLERHCEAEAEAALLRVSDGRLLWRDRLQGSTTARTEFVRHQPRLRTDEQCVLDAVRTAYAYLRFSLDDYLKRFEK